MKSKSSGFPKGFTLIEMIVTLVIVAVLGSMIYTYFGKVFYWGKLTEDSEDSDNKPPLNRLKHSIALHRVMQNITADYNVYPQWRAGTSYTKDNKVIPRHFNGYFYICDIGGTSATNEPDWSLISGGTAPTDGTVTWKYGGRLRDLLSLTTLRDRIDEESSTNAYGKNTDGTYTTFTVVTNSFIKLDNGIEENDPEGHNNILKVTLKNDQGETLTAIFYSEKTEG